jgi:hypothetical protein
MSTFPLSDPNNPQPQQNAAPQSDQPQPVQNTPATVAPASSQTPAQQNSTPAQTQPSQSQQNPPKPQSTQPSQNGTVSNAPAPVHPSVQKAGVLRQVAEALAGGPRYTTVIDPQSGATTRTRVPLSSRDIGMAIALEAISGSLAGLSQRGPGATGRAAEAGFQQVSQEQEQARAQQEQQAQQNFENQSQQLARRASIYEANSRAILNTSEAEQQGAEAIDKLTDINRQSGVLDVDPALTDNGGVPMTQQELVDAMKNGKLSPTDQLGPVAGRVEITNPDGTKRWEATHLVIRDPNTPVSLTQDQWDRFADAGVPGFPKGTKIGAGIQMPLRMMQNSNEIAASHYLAVQRLSDLRDTLDGTPYADKVPASIDFTKPGVNAAMQRFQRYVSHNAENLGDPYLALQEMGANKRDPKTGQMQPNPDAKYVATVMDALGGPALLLAAHNELDAQKKVADQYAVIDSADKANAVIASPKRFTPDQVSAAKSFLALSNEQGERKAAEDARARAVAEGTDVQAMYRFGRNPITGEQLSLDNAPNSMLVDAQGRVIPQDMTSTYKPSQNERQTADTARAVLEKSAKLRNAIQANPNLAGPLSGRSKQLLAKAGLGDAQAQEYLDDLSFLQSAAVKMHTGRFSVPIIEKMNQVIKPGMNVDQFNGALNSIDDIANLYAKEDQLITVADLKQTQNAAQRIANPGPGSATQRIVPPGATPGRDANGNIIGYRTADGQVIRF